MLCFIDNVVIFTEKYKKYVSAVGGRVGAGACAQVTRDNHLKEITDEAKLFLYLSTEESEKWQGDWLFLVINDIVSMAALSIL